MTTALPRTRVKDALASDRELAALCVKGWVRTLRRGKGVAFVELNDGSCFASIQIVLEPDLADFEEVARLGTGACVEVEGALVASPASGQRWEVKAGRVRILGPADDEYPLQKKRVITSYSIHYTKLYDSFWRGI